MRSPGQFAAVLDGSSAAGRLIKTLAGIHQRQFELKVERFQESGDSAEVENLRSQITRELFGQ